MARKLFINLNNIKYTNKFQKSYFSLQKKGYNMKKLDDLVDRLSKNNLLKSDDNKKLLGNLKGFFRLKIKYNENFGRLIYREEKEIFYLQDTMLRSNAYKK